MIPWNTARGDQATGRRLSGEDLPNFDFRFVMPLNHLNRTHQIRVTEPQLTDLRREILQCEGRCQCRSDGC